MSKIKIATDSTADIPKQFCEELNISVLLLTILADGVCGAIAFDIGMGCGWEFLG